jgi:GT2 family glycosyltransferase
MAQNLVSVIVPTFNRAYCLCRALDSALGQTHARVEVIVVDDGSTDATQQILRQRYGGEPRVRYVHQPNAGVVAARNAGLELSRGDYVALLDSDDSWFPWKLELQLACMRSRPEIGMVWSDMEAIDPGGRVTSRAFLRTMYHAYRWFPSPQSLFGAGAGRPVSELAPALVGGAGGSFWAGDIFTQMILGNLVHTSTVLLRRERLQQVVRFNPELKVSGEDYDFHLRTCRAGPVGFIEAATIQYQVGMPDRLTRPECKVFAAMNCLRTVEPMIRTERRRIHLSERAIARRLAEIHEWAGEAHWAAGDRRLARRHFRRSLGYVAGQPRAWRMFIGSFVPPRVYDTIRDAARFIGLRKTAPAAVPP